MAKAYVSLCSTSDPLAAVGERILREIADQCMPEPLAGCADVGAEFGTPQSGQTCAVNSRCLPECVITDVFERGTANEHRSDVPHCLELMPDGTVVPGNTDRALAYAEGRPAERDPALPVSAVG